MATNRQASLKDRASNVAAGHSTGTEVAVIDDKIGKVNAMVSAFAKVAPARFDAQRFARLCVNNLRTVRNLAACSDVSLLGGMMTAAQLGLEVGGPTGQSYLIPFWNTKLNSHEATFIVGYKGFIHLAYRSGVVKKIVGRAVKEGDTFSVDYGDDERLVHHVDLSKPRGESWAYYAVCYLPDGEHFGMALSRAEVDSYRARSKAKDSGPWVTDYDAMAVKTCVRRLAPFMPMGLDFAVAVAADETVAMSIDADALTGPPILDAESEEVEGGDRADEDPPEGEHTTATTPPASSPSDGQPPLTDSEGNTYDPDDPERPM